MELQYSEQNNGIRLIKLSGRLDIFGTGAIETKFAGYCAGESPRVAVDLTEVDFLASIGIRMLMLTAKSIASRAGKLALINPTPDVRGVLDITGITGIIPIYESLESAEAELLA